MSENMNENDYLKKHLESLENNNSGSDNNHINNIHTNTLDTTKTISELTYIPFDTSILPCGLFYPSGTTILIRAATVKEIQAYSMVDDKNYYDVVDKMDEILSSCVRVKLADGTKKTYMELRDPDRYFVTFLIREITFQNGNTLTTNTQCTCGTDNNLPLTTNNFTKYDIDPKLESFYNKSEKCFIFETQNNKTFKLAPPKIGLQKGFIEYIIKMTSEKKKMNMSFLKIIPFTLYDRNSITQEGIDAKLEEFQKMDDMSFQFLNSAVEKLTFGIKNIKSECSNCGLEVHSTTIFPNGPSGVFVIHDAFERFIKK